MQYTAQELNQAGQYIKNPLTAGTPYTFSLFRVPNSTGASPTLSGSGYFTYETVRDANGFYASPIPLRALGTHENADGANTLVSSSYIFSYELNTNGSEPQTSSFTFTPDIDIPISGVMFRATGDYDMMAMPIEDACGTPQSFPGGQSYPTTLNISLGTSTGTVGCLLDPLGIPDRFIVTWDGSIVIDTGYISANPSTYSLGGGARNSFTNALTGKIAPEGGGTYPLPPGGSGNNIIQSDGYPQVFARTAPGLINFTKNNSTSIATVDAYGPIGGTGWSVKINCPV